MDRSMHLSPVSCRIALAASLVLVLAGCGESRKTVAMLDGLRTGDTAKAEDNANALYGSSDDVLLKEMQLGLIHHLGGDLEASDKDLLAAANLVDDRRQGDATGTALSWVANDKVKAYGGRAFEQLQVDYYRTLIQ